MPDERPRPDMDQVRRTLRQRDEAREDEEPPVQQDEEPAADDEPPAGE